MLIMAIASKDQRSDPFVPESIPFIPESKTVYYNNSFDFRTVSDRLSNNNNNNNNTKCEENSGEDNENVRLKSRLKDMEKELDSTIKSLEKAVQEINRLNRENNDLKDKLS